MKPTLLAFFLIIFGQLQAQLADSCKLEMGVNLSGIVDYGTEIPFVDLMRSCRTWYAKDETGVFTTNLQDQMSFLANGYPTHLPQSVDGSEFEQYVATIWDGTDAWPIGRYTLLWEGTGTFNIWGTIDNVEQTGDHRYEFDLQDVESGVIEISILTSDANDPVHGMHLLMPGAEATYETQPFYSLWLDKLSPFKTVRFMDWGQTNNWGQGDDGWMNDELQNWEDRVHLDYYTYANNKGVPYELMVKLMNDQDVDGWVCIPHTASDDYIRQMATFFKNNLEPDRHLYVEYSNEIWNWLFGQTHWLNFHGCENAGVTWPEGIAPYVDNALSIWTEVYEGDLDRITRVIGTQSSWLDVSERICNNVDTVVYDAVSPTFYFGLSDAGDEALDELGATATTSDLTHYVRSNLNTSFSYIQDIANLANELNKSLVFYEGGQHITPHPFGVPPTYEQPLLDIQRDTAMYNLYTEWFDLIRTVQSGDEPLLLMNFGFIGRRSAQYGSWGILESLEQDTSVLFAPKYQAIIENMNNNCSEITATETLVAADEAWLYPNPTNKVFSIYGDVEDWLDVQLFNVQGQLCMRIKTQAKEAVDISSLASGVYMVRVQKQTEQASRFYKLLKL